MNRNSQTKKEQAMKHLEDPWKKDLGVLSKNDIIRAVIKIKPYLEEYDNEIVK